MKASSFLLLIIITLLSEGCNCFKGATVKVDFIKSGGRNEAIQNAILDFSITSKIYNKNSIFYVSFLDTVHRMILTKISNGQYKWIKGKAYDGIFGISICPREDQFLVNDSIKAGARGKLPSRIIEKNNKLFYWWDNEYPLTDSALKVFAKYNLLQDDKGGKIKFLDFKTDDAQKGVHYYFCKNDLTKYKKVVTNKGIGYYDAPSLDCNIPHP